MGDQNKQPLDRLRLLVYKYELTFGLYMLEPWEKATFSKKPLQIMKKETKD